MVVPTTRSSLGLIALVAMLASACATHEAGPAFRRAVLFGDRGISLPLPPPSLVDAPEQDVDLEGTVEGDDLLPADARVHVEDLEGDASAIVTIGPDDRFTVEGLRIDVTRHCFEVWVASASGESEHVFVQAAIEGANGLRTHVGCD
ncbi:MAG: hypothetical protein IPH07_07030 [Deltaproteobacteria bacterium]|jgi:hypothetical protein|nr:hypothetical protein [Deltaproteobacteria bacterium]MBK8236489.1 hypothetical protein [Deltaproteobacteria bacterium]MBK8717890.1 hypothetical protein [Deltaproteobacteria bacterium]